MFSTIQASRDYTTYQDKRTVYQITKLAKFSWWNQLVMQNPQNPFFKEINEKVTYLRGYEILSKFHITTPNFTAVKWHANRYMDKYEIIISATTDDHLDTVISTCKASLKGYCGIITGCEWDVEEDEPTHVTPLLLYIPDNKEEDDIECLILDSCAKDNYTPLLMENGIREENIYRTDRKRQADEYSCRTGALTLLRNALLALKYRNYTGGFNSVLEEGEVKNNTISQLPPEWDYTEQSTNPLLNEKHFVIRNFYSKKNKSPEKALDFRRRHAEIVDFVCSIRGNERFSPKKSLVPRQIDYWEFNNSLIYTVQRRVNTYLLKKGIKNSQLK